MTTVLRAESCENQSVNTPDAVQVLERDLRDIFGPRLQSLVAYRATGGNDTAPTLAVVDA